MNDAAERHRSQADGVHGDTSLDVASTGRSAALPPGRLICNRCGFLVRSKPWGCKNPCTNCGTVYPLGDCSD
jgi:hypothetical protein